MCEFCGCGEDMIKPQRASAKVAGSRLGGIPVVAVARSSRQHPAQHTNLKSSATTASRGLLPEPHR